MLSLTTTIRKLVFATLAILLSLSSGVGFAVEKGDILVRLRAIGVIPTGDGDGIAPDLLTSGLEAQPAAVPELDITYMATQNIGIELILATSPHDIDFTRANAAIGTPRSPSFIRVGHEKRHWIHTAAAMAWAISGLAVGMPSTRRCDRLPSS